MAVRRGKSQGPEPDDPPGLIRPLTGRAGAGLFMHLALDRGRANLALSRHRLRAITDDLEV